jgi:hypothetical protein
MSFLETYGPVMISGGAVLVSALDGSCFISANRELNRKQATLRLIQGSEEKKYYRTIQGEFFEFFPEIDPPSDDEVAVRAGLHGDR